jgi:RNA polymerase sigma factor (sigma-70 family)
MRLIARRRVIPQSADPTVDASRFGAASVDALAARFLREEAADARLALGRELATLAVRTHGAAIRAHCIARFGGDVTLGEEAAQRAFVTFWRRLPSYQGDAKVFGFLLGVTRKVCLEVARARSVALRDVPELDEDLPALASDPEDGVETTMLREERREAVVRALGRLDDKSRWLLTQRYAEEKPYEEMLIAYQARFGRAVTTEGGLRTAVFRALERLKTKLRGTDVDT